MLRSWIRSNLLSLNALSLREIWQQGIYKSHYAQSKILLPIENPQIWWLELWRRTMALTPAGNLAGNSKGPKIHRHGASILSKRQTISVEYENKKTNNNLLMHSTAVYCQFSKKRFFYLISCWISHSCFRQ